MLGARQTPSPVFHLRENRVFGPGSFSAHNEVFSEDEVVKSLEAPEGQDEFQAKYWKGWSLENFPLLF